MRIIIVDLYSSPDISQAICYEAWKHCVYFVSL